MRKLILAATGLVCLSGVSYFFSTAFGQGKGAPPADEAMPHKVALIDMGYVFNEYEKLKELQEDFNAEQQKAEADAKRRIDVIKGKQEEIKTFKQGSQEYIEREKDLLKYMSDFEAFKKQTELELARRRANMLQTVYLEVQDMVEWIAKRKGYTMVLRFNREELSSNDPQKLMQGLQRQVIYHRAEDDITNVALQYLNQQYRKSITSTNDKAVQPASGTKKPSAPKTPEGGRRGNQ